MHHSPIHGWRRWAAVCGAALALVGCTPAGPAAPAAPAAPDITIMLEAAPEGKEGTYLIVHLVDAGGAAITDADVALEGNMTHAGMVPVVTDAVADDADGEADGHYQVPFVFTMLGDWIVRRNLKGTG